MARYFGSMAALGFGWVSAEVVCVIAGCAVRAACCVLCVVNSAGEGSGGSTAFRLSCGDGADVTACGEEVMVDRAKMCFSGGGVTGARGFIADMVVMA
jgi:hypothetical protein